MTDQERVNWPSKTAGAKYRKLVVTVSINRQGGIIASAMSSHARPEGGYDFDGYLPIDVPEYEDCPLETWLLVSQVVARALESCGRLHRATGS